MRNWLRNWLQRFSDWQREQFADIRNPRSLYFLVANHLESRRLPTGPCGLRIRVPRAHWEWLQQQQLQAEYEQGLTDFVHLVLQHRGLPPLIEWVSLAQGDQWGTEWSALDSRPVASEVRQEQEWVSHEVQMAPTEPVQDDTAGANSPPGHLGAVHGYFVVLDEAGAEWIPCSFQGEPRLPTDAEAHAPPERLRDILQGLIPSAGGPLWHSGEPQIVCRRRVLFLSTEEDQA